MSDEDGGDDNTYNGETRDKEAFLRLNDLLGGDLIDPADHYSAAFNRIKNTEERVKSALNSAGQANSLARKQDLCDRLKHWIESDYGTNEIKRAKIVRQLTEEGFKEETAHNVTKPPETLSHEQVDAYMEYRAKKILGHDDGRPDDEVRAKLYTLSDHITAGIDTKSNYKKSRPARGGDVQKPKLTLHIFDKDDQPEP